MSIASNAGQCRNKFGSSNWLSKQEFDVQHPEAAGERNSTSLHPGARMYIKIEKALLKVLSWRRGFATGTAYGEIHGWVSLAAC